MKYPGKLKTLILSAALAAAGSIPLLAFDNTNILVEEAVNHIYQQRYKQAHQALKQAYEQSPRHPGVHFNLGRLFELTGNFDEALKEYRLAASLDTSMVAARRGIARCSVELKRIKAYNAQTEAQTQAPTAAPVVKYEPPQSAAPARIITQQPAQTPVQAPVQPRPTLPTQTARVVTQPATPALPPIQPTNRISTQDLKLPPLPLRATAQASRPAGEQRAETLLDSGKTDEAIAALENILQNNPDSPRAHFLLGKALSLKGDLFASIKHLEECLRVDDKFYDAYYLLGRNYSRVNLLEDAIKNYQIYYVVKPQASVALEMARIYETMGSPEKAKEYYARANAMNPGNPNLQMRLSESAGNLANDLYLRGNHAFTTNKFEEAANLFSQALATGNLLESSRRDAVRKLEVARFKIREEEEKQRPAREGFTATRGNFAGTNLQYWQLNDINFKTRFTGPITVEWRGYIARKITRHGRDFLLMIKELSQDELDAMSRERNDYRLNSHFNNQPTFLLATRRGGFPPFAREGQMITFNGTTDWKFYDIINDLGQLVRMPSFEFISAYPD
ncbi:MAG: tetratricopeptide repeat protein [Candidatus Riflebacteria bacterium]|nr:tetratricopeptide repeat protein [Candidatus Riflebacteria bacterium]